MRLLESPPFIAFNFFCCSFHARSCASCASFLALLLSAAIFLLAASCSGVRLLESPPVAFFFISFNFFCIARSSLALSSSCRFLSSVNFALSKLIVLSNFLTSPPDCLACLSFSFISLFLRFISCCSFFFFSALSFFNFFLAEFTIPESALTSPPFVILLNSPCLSLTFCFNKPHLPPNFIPPSDSFGEFAADVGPAFDSGRAATMLNIALMEGNFNRLLGLLRNIYYM